MDGILLKGKDDVPSDPPLITRTILFDLDGTLVDTIDLFEKASLRALGEIDVVVDHVTFLRWYQDGLHLRDWLLLRGKYRAKSDVC